jgi:transcriptional regulator with XRE-family HTH domain
MGSRLSARHREIGRVLGELRQAAGLELSDLADAAGCDRSKLSRVEEGIRGIRAGDLSVLLEACDADLRVREALMALCQVHGTGGWWDMFPGVLPADVVDLAAAERAAGRVLAYAPSVLPPLLWTEGYARAAVAAGSPVSGHRGEDAVRAALAWARAAASGACGEVKVVVGAAALRYSPAWAAVMREQAEYLAVLAAECLWVDVRVLPFGAGVHVAGGSAGFEVAELCCEPAVAMVHVDGIGSGFWPAGSGPYVAAFGRLKEAALSPGKSIWALRRLGDPDGAVAVGGDA